MVQYRTTAVKTGNIIGKSYLAAGLLLWFSVIHPGSWCIVAAPTQQQLLSAVWKELVKAYLAAERAGLPLGGRFDGLTLQFGPDWQIEGLGSGSVEARSGRHAQHLLAVIDEASGIKPSVMEAIDSLNPSRYVYFGNPLRPEGKFYEVCELSGDNPFVHTITIPSTESPDIDEERSPRGLADRTWLEAMRFEYGEDSLWWSSHVAACFPGELSEALIPIPWLAAAAQVAHVGGGSRRMGVDIAKGSEGDASMIVIRDDNGVLGAWWSNRWSLEETARHVRQRQIEFGVEPNHVTYDSAGVGTDFDNRLRAAGIVGAKGYMGAAAGTDKYANLRSLCGWLLRRRLDPNRTYQAKPSREGKPGLIHPQKPFSIPQHLVNTFRRELQGARTSLDSLGRIALENKDEFVRRLKFSPNFLDALMMTFAFPHA